MSFWPLTPDREMKNGSGQLDSPGPDMGNGVCASTPETVYLAGEYSDVIAFDSQLLPGDRNQNVFWHG